MHREKHLTVRNNGVHFLAIIVLELMGHLQLLKVWKVTIPWKF